MAVIKSGAGSDLWTIDPTSKSGRVTLYDSAGNPMNVLPTTEGVGRGVVLGVYSAAQVDLVGQTGAAYNYMCLFNPVGSGRVLAVSKVDYNAYAVAVSISKNSIRLTNVAGYTSGGVDSSAIIQKHDPSMPGSVAKIYTGNPTLALGQVFKAFPPPVTITAAGGITSPEIDYNPAKEFVEIVLPAGTGLVLNQAVAGTATQNFNFRFVWYEIGV